MELTEGKYIRIRNGRIFITSETSFSEDATNLSGRISPSIDRLLKVAAGYNDGTLILEVRNYQANAENAFFLNQKDKPDKPVNRIYFRNLDYTKIVELLWTYSPLSLKSICREDTIEKLPSNVGRKSIQLVSELFTESLPFKTKIKWDKAAFQPGKFVCEHSFANRLRLPIVITILNPCLREELQHIAPFFSKKFGSKYFEISGVAKYANNVLTEITDLESPQLSAINEELITEFKKKEINSLRRIARQEKNEKTLHTFQELVDSLPESSGLNLLDISMEEVVDLFAAKEDIRNRDQLRYLAANRLTSREKILFTLSPKFGFLFTLETETEFHFCWELLDSHATYVWSLSKEKFNYSEARSKIESSVSIVIDSGRISYRRAYRENEIDGDMVFNVLNHLDGDFVNWKSEIVSILRTDESVSEHLISHS